MPMSTMIGSDIFYVCLMCGNTFSDKQLASQCEEHCRAHRKVNPELTAKAAKCPC